MVKVRFWLLLIVLLFAFISLVNAKSFSLDPCSEPTTITEDVNKIYMTSGCFYVEFDKIYGEESPILFYDSYNNDYFELKLHSLAEHNSADQNQQRLYSFEDIGITASIEGDKVVYTSADGKIRLLYSIHGNQIKAGLEVLNWNTYYTNSIFKLRTKVHKEDNPNTHFINLPAVVDGVEQPLIFESEFSGNNEFIVQTIYEGSDFTFLEIDPLYQVDYSPAPAKHLVTGDCNIYADSQFGSTIDITTSMSDNLTNVSYNTKDAGLNGDAISGSWTQTYDSQYTWFLRAYKTNVGDSGTSYIYAYSSDGDNLSANFSTYLNTSGVGWKNYQVNSQMDYMTNTLGLNYTKLRIYTANNCLWAEMRLRKEVNDTQSPIIHDCWIGQTPVYCNGQAEWVCNITDNLDVNDVTFTISGVNYSAIQNNSLWYYNMVFTDTDSVNETLTLTDVYATDIMNLTNHSSESEAINHDCRRLRLIYPLAGEVVDENSDMAVTVDVLEANLDSIWLNITCFNGSSCVKTNFTKGLTSDNFNTDTEGIKWVKGEDVEIGQSCDVDIDGINPNKMTLSIDTANISSGVQCGYNSIPRVDGNFDAIIDFNMTTFEVDSGLTFRSAPTDSLFAVGIRAYILIIKQTGGIEYRFGYNDGINPTQVTYLDTTDTYGKMRIKRSNMTVSHEVLPIFNLYIWNNTLQEWYDPVGDIQLPNSSRIQHIQIKPFSEGSNYGNINLTVDNFSIITDNYSFEVIEGIAQNGRANITVFANWTTGETNQTETWINITAINDPPSRPFFEAPETDEIIDFGVYDIIWGQVIDEENDDVKFNITLLYPNLTYYSTIVSNYGNINSTTYQWNTTAVPIGNYSMEIKVFETATEEKLSTTETLAGTFSIQNLTCVEDWVVQYESCLVNDTQLKYYTDNNACGTFGGLPIDNGTYVYCNYCSEDLETLYSACYLSSGIYIRDVSYQDNNYFSCCAITSLVSDCSVDYSPYNTTTTENCSVSLESDFDISLDTDLTFGWGIGGLNSDKASGKIWINNTNTSYYCLSYVETYSGNLVQTNPPYTKRVVGLLQIFGKEYEDREYFITHNGLANVYWTSDKLVIDGRQYIFGVECAGNGQNLKSEMLATVGHNPVNEPTTRFFWAKENFFGLFLGLLFLIILAFIIFGLWGMRK